MHENYSEHVKIKLYNISEKIFEDHVFFTGLNKTLCQCGVYDNVQPEITEISVALHKLYTKIKNSYLQETQIH